jgi:hypothetical protein
MSKLLEEAIKRLRALPRDRQDAAAELLLSVVDQDPARLALTPEQQAEVRRRLGDPDDVVSHEQVVAFFARAAE